MDEQDEGYRKLKAERDTLLLRLAEIYRIASDVHVGELSALRQIRDLAGA